MKAYEYIIKIKDRASKSLRHIAQRSGVADNRLTRMVSRMRLASNEGKRMSGVFSKLSRLVAGAFIVGSLSGFVSNVISVRAEFEKYQAVLTNTFQSAKAGETAMNMIKDFAAKTPFQLNELTGAYVKLVNRGFVPTQKQIRSLGDLASSQGKSFGQLTEAILDAETGEFERLKEFGIKASKAGNKVTFAFKGVKKTVDANATSIRKALISFGEMQGVTGSMAAISKTLGGRLSNLKDQWNNLLNAIGKNSGGVMSSVIDLLANRLTFLSKNLNSITTWLGNVWDSVMRVGLSFKDLLSDVYLLITGSNNTTSALGFLSDGFTAIAWVADVVATGIRTLVNWFINLSTPAKKLIVTFLALKAAIWLVNLALYANPVGGIIAGILVLIGVIGLAVKYTNGWGESWSGMVTGSKEVFNAFVSYVNARFNTLVNRVMIGIGKIKTGWFSFKETLGLGDSSQNKAMIDQISKDAQKRKQSIADGYKQVAQHSKNASKAFSKVGISVDSKGIEKDFNKLKNSFKKASGGASNASKGNYAEDVLSQFGANSLSGANTGGSSGSNGAGSGGGSSIGGITSGGKKQTNISVHFDKLQDTTEIHTINMEEGTEEMEEKLTDMFLRILNSVSQMQTSIG